CCAVAGAANQARAAPRSSLVLRHEMVPTFAPDVLPAPGADGHRGSRCDRSLTSGATFTRPRTPGCEPAMSRSSFYRGAHNKQALPVPATARDAPPPPDAPPPNRKHPDDCCSAVAPDTPDRTGRGAAG